MHSYSERWWSGLHFDPDLENSVADGYPDEGDSYQPPVKDEDEYMQEGWEVWGE